MDDHNSAINEMENAVLFLKSEKSDVIITTLSLHILQLS